MPAAIYGSRGDGHAKVCLRLARKLGIECVGSLDDISPEAELLDLQPLGTRAVLPDLARQGVDTIVLGFGDGQARRELIRVVRDAGLHLPALLHPDASVDGSATIAAGAVVLRGAVVGDDVRIGEAALVNVGALLTHDVQIDAGASIGPGAILAGRTHVGAGAELGAGAILLPDAHVGECARVGAGAVVTGGVEAGTTVVGLPARPLDRDR